MNYMDTNESSIRLGNELQNEREKAGITLREMAVKDASIRKYNLSSPMLTRDDIMYALRSLSGDPSDPQYAQKLIDIFLNAVYIFDDDTAALSVNFQTSDGKPITIKTALQVKKESSSLVGSGSPFATNPNLWIYGDHAVSMIRITS